jgi:formate hydrogenlyase subunit 3/multisubunit Na+/H+ antiporter MnhD subunit
MRQEFVTQVGLVLVGIGVGTALGLGGAYAFFLWLMRRTMG